MMVVVEGEVRRLEQLRLAIQAAEVLINIPHSCRAQARAWASHVPSRHTFFECDEE